MEICVDSLASAHAAVVGGASRLEVCSALSLGGLTPSNALVKLIKRKHPDIALFAMIRPREGNFFYSKEEVEEMRMSIEELHTVNVDGFVFGALKRSSSRDGSTEHIEIDSEICALLMSVCAPKPVTFHRAFDLVYEMDKSLELCVYLGFSRILSSGLMENALLGIENLAEMYKRSNGRIIILPGCGLNGKNITQFITRLQKEHGIFLEEFHASCRQSSSDHFEGEHMSSRFDFGNYRACDTFEVKLCVESVSKLASRTEVDI